MLTCDKPDGKYCRLHTAYCLCCVAYPMGVYLQFFKNIKKNFLAPGQYKIGHSLPVYASHLLIHLSLAIYKFKFKQKLNHIKNYHILNNSKFQQPHVTSGNCNDHCREKAGQESSTGQYRFREGKKCKNLVHTCVCVFLKSIRKNQSNNG